MNSQMSLIFALFLIVGATIAGMIVDMLKRQKEDYRPVFILEHWGVANRWLMPAHDDGWFVTWRSMPWVMSLESVLEMTLFIRKYDIKIKQRDIDMIRSLETRKEILNLVATWTVE